MISVWGWMLKRFILNEQFTESWVQPLDGPWKGRILPTVKNPDLTKAVLECWYTWVQCRDTCWKKRRDFHVFFIKTSSSPISGLTGQPYTPWESKKARMARVISLSSCLCCHVVIYVLVCFHLANHSVVTSCVYLPANYRQEARAVSQAEWLH